MSKLICIDPGHSGKFDPGAVNGKYKEAIVTLGLSKKIAQRLKELGYRVVMTRDEDKALTLQQRCDIANKTKADIFISIHTNSSTNKLAEGIETFKYPKSKHKLAECIQNALVKNFPEEKNRGVKESQFYVLKNTKMPAVLCEVGFISHAETAEKLYSYSYQMKLSRVIVEGVQDFLGK